MMHDRPQSVFVDRHSSSAIASKTTSRQRIKRKICLRDLSNQRDVLMPSLISIKVSHDEEDNKTITSTSVNSVMSDVGGQQPLSSTALLSVNHLVGVSGSNLRLGSGANVGGLNLKPRPHVSHNKSNSGRHSPSSSSNSQLLMSQISPSRLSSTSFTSPNGDSRSTWHRLSDSSLAVNTAVVHGESEHSADHEDETVKHLNKLKRFLTTLQQFGFDISAEIGEKVRGLVLALVNSDISIEDFHTRLQESTNFPLRPFVVPFLKVNLPLLQRELMQSSPVPSVELRSSSFHRTQPPTLSQHSPPDHYARDQLTIKRSPSQDLILSSTLNENGKRPAVNSGSIVCESLTKHRTPHATMDASGLSPYSSSSSGRSFGKLLRLEDMRRYRQTNMHGSLSVDVSENQERMDRHEMNPISNSAPSLERIDDDWKYVEDLLQCIVGMVERCKRVLATLESRGALKSESQSTAAVTQTTQHSTSSLFNQADYKVADVTRRIDDVVHEVKFQASVELQKAVTSAEIKAAQIVASERQHMEQVIKEVRRQAQHEAVTLLRHQVDSADTCLNCGRVASETCSGCHVARYCGAFCQHKNWESHHLVCGSHSSNRRQVHSEPVNFNANCTVVQDKRDIRYGDTGNVRIERDNDSDRIHHQSERHQKIEVENDQSDKKKSSGNPISTAKFVDPDSGHSDNKFVSKSKSCSSVAENIDTRNIGCKPVQSHGHPGIDNRYDEQTQANKYQKDIQLLSTSISSSQKNPANKISNHEFTDKISGSSIERENVEHADCVNKLLLGVTPTNNIA